MLLHRYAKKSVHPIPMDHSTEGALKAPLFAIDASDSPAAGHFAAFI